MSDQQRIRVLFVSKWLDVGGAERFVSTVLSKLDTQSFESHLVLFRNIIGYPLPDHVPVTVLDQNPVHRWWHIPRFAFRLASEIRLLRPDVVISAYGYPNIVTGFALRLVRERPRWLARISTNPEWEERGIRRPLFHFAYSRADRFVANSASLGQLFSTIYPYATGLTWHLPNPADFESIEAAADEPQDIPSADRFRLVAVGRLAPAKRVDLLIAAVDQLRRRRDIELVLCGDGLLREELESLVHRLGLGEYVIFAGFGNPFPWLRSADLFVLSSDHEGSPNALIEAQGLGIPAISTDCAFGPAEIIEDGVTGRLVPVGDVRALVVAIERAASDSQWLASAGAAAQSRARQMFDAAAVTELLEGHLRELARGGGSLMKTETSDPPVTESGDSGNQPDEHSGDTPVNRRIQR